MNEEELNELNELRGVAERLGATDFVNVGNIIRDNIEEKWVNPTGAYNIALKNNLIALSVADDWKEAKQEWKATGKIWYVPMRDESDRLPEYHRDKHPHKCICGHKIAWHFEIINTENDVREIVGSEHIGFWMVARYLIEDEKFPADMITQERIEMWVKEAVKSMKAEWWWGEYGEQFEEMFNAIKETDLRINVRGGESFWDYDTARYETQKLIRKKAVSKMGEPNYAMASIVWRWNHQDNDSRQKDTRGWPNERLWSDLQIFFYSLELQKNKLAVQDNDRAKRIAQILKEAEEEAERQRIANIEREKRQAENRRLRIEREAEEQKLRDTAFERTCGDWGIPQFTAEIGKNTWEVSFLTSMISKINSLNFISEKQKQRVIKIVNKIDEPATEKQLAYIRKLGGEPTPAISKRQASELIDILKNVEKLELAGEEEE